MSFDPNVDNTYIPCRPEEIWIEHGIPYPVEVKCRKCKNRFRAKLGSNKPYDKVTCPKCGFWVYRLY